MAMRHVCCDRSADSAGQKRHRPTACALLFVAISAAIGVPATRSVEREADEPATEQSAVPSGCPRRTCAAAPGARLDAEDADVARAARGEPVIASRPGQMAQPAEPAAAI